MTSQAILTAKSFFVSFGICVGALLLLSAAYSLVVYIRRRCQEPGGVYLQMFKGMILDMKEVIELGGLAIQHLTYFRTKTTFFVSLQGSVDLESVKASTDNWRRRGTDIQQSVSFEYSNLWTLTTNRTP
jgi:hypothetical protein